MKTIKTEYSNSYTAEDICRYKISAAYFEGKKNESIF